MSLRKRNYCEVRHGMTIVELLVVLGIMSILLGIAATAVKTGTRGKKQREAARQVNAYIAAAQARAVQLNRPVGVEIVRNVRSTTGSSIPDIGLVNTSLLMYTIETPPTYAGDTSTAVTSVTPVVKPASGDANYEPLAPQGYFTATFSDSASTSMITVADFIRNGDQIRFAYRGPVYRIVGPVDTSTRSFKVTWDPGQAEPTHTGTVTVPFQIYPQPIRSMATPLQLPTDMCIDLSCSGTGNVDREFAAWTGTGGYNSIRFTFSPRGNIYRIYFDDGYAEYPQGNVHLLVGKYDQAVDTIEILGTDGLAGDVALGSVNYKHFIYPGDYNSDFEDLTTNLGDGTSMWVSVNYITGQVSTTRNRVIPTSVLDPTALDIMTLDAAINDDIIAASRDYAKRVLLVQGEGNQ
ncbi:pilus assembly FimT family protein [Bremerella alba]|uniref:Prepilin-type N-terminal cleavage/methylation domain-containing protein n=1 Tax=Bremerella alba TaxID=980252 RepID=A0A7V8V9E6_9BACT|nr:type II secretion system protein [Bremerella alba]MBA2117315.1 hypothetical protein [Bremerella alba]